MEESETNIILKPIPLLNGGVFAYILALFHSWIHFEESACANGMTVSLQAQFQSIKLYKKTFSFAIMNFCKEFFSCDFWKKNSFMLLAGNGTFVSASTSIILKKNSHNLQCIY